MFLSSVHHQNAHTQAHINGAHTCTHTSERESKRTRARAHDFMYSVPDELCSEGNDLKSKFFKPLLTAATILTISVKKLHIFVEKLVRNPTMCLLKLWDL